MSDTHTPLHIVITGITGGLGYALAHEFISMGHIVSGCGTRRNVLKAWEGNLNGGDASFVDVTSFHAVHRWAERICRTIGPPHFLLNNAALINTPAPLWEISPDHFSRITDVNIKGVFHVIRAFVPHMLKLPQAVVVNFSSGWGRSTAPEVAPYCASKWAIEGLTGSLARELPAHFSAVSLNPGVIATPMLHTVSPALAQSAQSPAEWAAKAAPTILAIEPGETPVSLSI